VPLAAGGGSAQDRWIAAQQRVLERSDVEISAAVFSSSDASGAQAAPADAAGTSSTSDASDLQAAPAIVSMDAAAARADAPASQLAQPGDVVENQAAQAGTLAEHRAAAAVDMQPGALTEHRPEAGAPGGGSNPSTDEEQRQQLANADALTRVADMEAVRKAISMSVASASTGELPAASVNCAKVGVMACVKFEPGSVHTARLTLPILIVAPSVCSGVACVQNMSRPHCKAQACKYGEAPGYWRVIPPGRRQWALYDDACELADLLSLHLQVKLSVFIIISNNSMYMLGCNASAQADWCRSMQECSEVQLPGSP
jgi:hypothetical protein